MMLDFCDDMKISRLLEPQAASVAQAKLQTHENTFPTSQLCVPVASSSLETER